MFFMNEDKLREFAKTIANENNLKQGKHLIYAHLFPNSKVYIGQTKQNVKRRWGNGSNYLRTQNYVGNAIKKYGWNNIKHIVLLEKISAESANKCEKILIKMCDSTNPQRGYNLRPGGSDATLGEQAKRKLSELHSKEIGQYDLKGNLISTYRNSIDAEKQTGFNHKCICACANPNRQSKNCLLTYKNYIWRYTNDNSHPVSWFIDEIAKINDKKFNKKPLFQYDIFGKFIKKYHSHREACNEINMTEANISKALKNFAHYMNGHIWSDHALSKEELNEIITKLHTKKGLPHPISQFDTLGNHISSYCSLVEAEENSVDSMYQIKKSLIDGTVSSGGYFWKKYEVT